VAKGLGLEHQPVDVRSGERVCGAWHIRNVYAYRSHFKEWLRRFNGVATSCLPNDLGWFRALDRNGRSAAKPASVLALVIGTWECHRPMRTGPKKRARSFGGSGLNPPLEGWRRQSAVEETWLQLNLRRSLALNCCSAICDLRDSFRALTPM
jgi:hypothetical protein